MIPLDLDSTPSPRVVNNIRHKLLTARKSDHTYHVSSHQAVLQTISYNITEICVGVVKAAPIHKNNPTTLFFPGDALFEGVRT